MDAKEELKEIADAIDSAAKSEFYRMHARHAVKLREILSTHDLVPVDSGPFRPEDVPGLERVSKIENNSWSRWEMAGLIIEGNPNVGIAIHAGEFNRYRYTGPWPSKTFALLLLRELGIGGGK
jgi:hypothetical protein